MSQQILAYEITKLSVAPTWEVAKEEWMLNDVWISETPDTCTCGHYPIKEICLLKNKLNGKYVPVGNCCVKKFMGLPSDLIFQAIKRIGLDITKSLNVEALNYAKGKGWINDWEYGFYCNTFSKRKLSEKQKAKRIQVNTMFLQRMSKPVIQTYANVAPVTPKAPIMSVLIPF